MIWHFSTLLNTLTFYRNETRKKIKLNLYISCKHSEVEKMEKRYFLTFNVTFYYQLLYEEKVREL